MEGAVSMRAGKVRECDMVVDLSKDLSLGRKANAELAGTGTGIGNVLWYVD